MHEKHHCTGQLCIFCLSWEYKNVYQCPCTDFCVDNKLWPEARQTSTVTLTQWSFSVSRYRSVSYCFILTGQLQRWNVMVSLKWLEEPWVLTKVSFITRKGKNTLGTKVRCANFLRHRQSAVFVSCLLTQRTQRTNYSNMTIGHLRSIKLVLFCWETAGRLSPTTMATIIHPQAFLLYRQTNLLRDTEMKHEIICVFVVSPILNPGLWPRPGHCERLHVFINRQREKRSTRKIRTDD